MTKKHITNSSKKIISIPPIYFFLGILSSIASFFVFRSFNLISFPLSILIGIPLILCGLFLIRGPHFLLKKNNTPENFKKSTCLVRNGLYKYSRNPMYLGFLIFLIGLSFALGNLISFISPMLFFTIINWMFIPYEEEKMEYELGTEYLEYKKKIKRWI